MKTYKKRTRVLWYESAGFAVILGCIWTVELTGVENLVLWGKPRAINWPGVTMETLLILMVWAVVFVLSRRLVSHLLYLEAFLRVCAWCRKVGYEDKWIPLEEFFEQGLHVGTTHGVCPACLQKLKDDTTRFFRQQSAKGTIPRGQDRTTATAMDKGAKPVA